MRIYSEYYTLKIQALSALITILIALLFSYQQVANDQLVIGVLCFVSIAALLSTTNWRAVIALFAFGIGVVTAVPYSALFAPLLFLFHRDNKKIAFLFGAILIIFTLMTNDYRTCLLILLLGAGAALLHFILFDLTAVIGHYYSAKDTNKELSLSARRKQQQFNALLDDKLKSSILEERNRIARELHDHIGHTISSAIVQAEAHKVLYLQNDNNADQNAINALDKLIDTLKTGMRDIRTSLHHLHDTSLDLESKLREISTAYPTIATHLTVFDTDALPYDIKRQLLRAISEILTNSAKHSDATKMKISIIKQTTFYEIVAKDNGSRPVDTLTMGMGFNSLIDLAKSCHGRFSYGYDRGFYVHLTLVIE